MTFLYTFIFFLAFNLSFGIPQHTQKYLPPFRLSSSAMRNHNGHFYQDGIFVRTTADSLFVRKLYERCLVLNMCPKYYRLITLKLLSQSSGASFFFFFKNQYSAYLSGHLLPIPVVWPRTTALALTPLRGQFPVLSLCPASAWVCAHTLPAISTVDVETRQ